MAVLSGDFLFCHTYQSVIAEAAKLQLTERQVLTVIRILFTALREMILGQTEEIVHRHKSIPVDKILEIIKNKTARFIEACFEVAGVLAGARPAKVKLLKKFGCHFGTAFQIADDLLDAVGRKSHLAKPVRQDRRNGVCTLPAKVGLKAAWSHFDREMTSASRLLGSLPQKQDQLKDLFYRATLGRFTKVSGAVNSTLNSYINDTHIKLFKKIERLKAN